MASWPKYRSSKPMGSYNFWMQLLVTMLCPESKVWRSEAGRFVSCRTLSYGVKLFSNMVQTSKFPSLRKVAETQDLLMAKRCLAEDPGLLIESVVGWIEAPSSNDCHSATFGTNQRGDETTIARQGHHHRVDIEAEMNIACVTAALSHTTTTVDHKLPHIAGKVADSEAPVREDSMTKPLYPYHDGIQETCPMCRF